MLLVYLGQPFSPPARWGRMFDRMFVSVVLMLVAGLNPMGVADGPVPADFTPSPDEVQREMARVEDPPAHNRLAYNRREGVVKYEVQITIGESDKEVYTGTLAYAFDGSKRIDAQQSLTEKTPRNSSAIRYRLGMPGYPFGNRTPRSPDYLEPIRHSRVGLQFDANGVPERGDSIDPYGSMNRSSIETMNLMLGDYLLLPFIPLSGEPLAEGEQRTDANADADTSDQWSTQDAIMVSRQREDRDPYGGQLSYLLGQPQQAVAPAMEKADYRIIKQTADTVTIEQKYTLDATKLSAAPLELTGDGTIVFDKRLGMPTSVSLRRTVKVEIKGAKLTIPVAIDVTLASSTDLMPLTDQERREKAIRRLFDRSPEGRAAAKKRAEQRQREQEKFRAQLKEAEQERQRERDAEFVQKYRKEALEKLKKVDKYHKFYSVQSNLDRVTDRDDPELFNAILDTIHRLGPVPVTPDMYRLAAKFNPKLKEVAPLLINLTSYAAPIKVPGEPFTANDPPVPGALILIRPSPSSDWRAKRILRRDGDQIYYSDFSSDYEHPRPVAIGDVRRVPPEALPYLSPELAGIPSASPQPNGPSQPNSPSQANGSSESADGQIPHSNANVPVQPEPGPITWVDSSGQYRVEAFFVKLENDQLTLRKTDGKTVRIPLSKLDAASQTTAKRIANPFKEVFE